MPRITFPCPNQTCPKEWDVEEKHVGKTVKCPVCNEYITVPSPHIPPPVQASSPEPVPEESDFMQSFPVVESGSNQPERINRTLGQSLWEETRFEQPVPVPEDSVSLPPLDPSYRSHFANIILAVKEGTIDDVRYFIEERGVDVNARDSGTGMIPLHFAAGRSNVEILTYLISHGANININLKDNNGCTPLHWAATIDPNVKVLAYLISQGANINEKDNGDRTPLHLASESCLNVEIIAYLISQGADINAKNYRGCTPLHLATCVNPNFEVLKYLISKGADINAKDVDGCTPLHHVVSRNLNDEILKYLISKGADVNAKDNDGDTALAYAVTDEKKEKRRILREAGARAGSSGSGTDGCGCLVFLVALGGLLTSGVCGLVFAILDFLR